MCCKEKKHLFSSYNLATNKEQKQYVHKNQQCTFPLDLFLRSICILWQEGETGKGSGKDFSILWCSTRKNNPGIEWPYFKNWHVLGFWFWVVVCWLFFFSFFKVKRVTSIYFKEKRRQRKAPLCKGLLLPVPPLLTERKSPEIPRCGRLRPDNFNVKNLSEILSHATFHQQF